jgi:hypothetical protein
MPPAGLSLRASGRTVLPMNATRNNPHRPWGWIFALAVALLFATVILGVIAIGLIEKRKQRLYRLRGAEAPVWQQTNSPTPAR